MKDSDFLRIAAVILIAVGISVMAASDPNNPTDLGLPVTADSFNIFSLASQAPQIPLLNEPVFSDAEQYCWLDFFCPDLGGLTDVAKAVEKIAVLITNFFFMIANGVLQVGTVITLLTVNFLTLFNFSSWVVFQGHFFLQFFAVALTAILGGAVALWIISKVTGAIPFVGGSP